MRVVAVTLATLLAATTARADGLAPHTSWAQLPWSNGRGAGAYDASRARMVMLRDHLFQRTQAAPAVELMYDAYPGLRVNGQNLWLTDRPVDRAGYDDGRGIVRVQQTYQGVQVVMSMWSPFTVDAPVTVVTYEVTNTNPTALADSALYAIDNVHAGGGADGSSAERIQWVGGAFEERGARGLILHRPSAGATHACSPANPYQTVQANNRLANATDSGTLDDAVPGFEWDLGGLAPNQTRTFSLVLAYRADGNRAALDTQLASIAADPATALADARAEWDAFFARAQEPDGLTADERAVYRQQLAVLRMGQVRAEGAGSGQLVAALPTGMWNIAWVRDQAYATMALVRAGLAAEAKAALAFWWGTAQAGHYVCCDTDGNPWVGTAYAPSVVRYTGDGVEESDADQNGPNIEFDGFGLALATTADYVKATGDTQLVTDHASQIFTNTADVLVSLIEGSGANAGLVRADSSIWETHWYNGGRKHFAYTQVAAVYGLRRAGELADAVGRTSDGDRYRAAADRIAAAFAQHFVTPGGALRGNLEEPDGHQLDAAAVEALNWGVAADATAAPSLDAWKAGLWNTEVGHGYHRNDDGGDYDSREWIVIDLRIASAARKAGRPGDGDQLIDWVTQQARANADLIPENYDRMTGDYSGSIPMVGFGAGTYVMALWDRGAHVAPGGGDGGVDGGGGGGGSPAPGGGCCSASSGASSIALAVLVLGLGRRRRRG